MIFLDPKSDDLVDILAQSNWFKEKIDLAKKLLKILDVPTIAKKTGLSIEEVENLKKK